MALTPCQGNPSALSPHAAVHSFPRVSLGALTCSLIAAFSSPTPWMPDSSPQQLALPRGSSWGRTVTCVPCSWQRISPEAS